MSSSRTLGLLCLIAVGLGLFFALRTPPAPSTAEALANADTVEREENLATLEPTPDPRAVVVPANPGRETAPAPPDPSPEAEDEDQDTEELLVLTGIVRSQEGPGIEGAEVRFGPAVAITTRGGAFELPAARVREVTPIVATKPGYEPGMIADYGKTVLTCNGSLEPVELVLGSSPGKLDGRLVDRAGEPCPGWEIALYDPSPVYPWNHAGTSAEDLAGELSNRQRTNDEGAFRIAGLRSDRTYRLRAWQEKTLQSFVSDQIPTGIEEYTFVIDLEAVHAKVHGVVVGLDGVPLEGIKIRLSMFVDTSEIDGVLRNNEGHTGQTVFSDEFGRFSFRDAPHENVFLRFHGGNVAAQPFWFRPDSPVHDLHITLLRQGRFRLAVTDEANRPDALEVWSVHGEVIAVKQGGAFPPPGRVELPAEGELEYRTTDDARWLVLYREGREIGREELLIVPGTTVPVGY